ncbi:hypothetical protein TraAM80_06528 [Trypanosoma rangeli]|uniref:Uncharacterized protein n=1 Tax=Trypanosoma rangeli TaxID=5698 RepID=A0A422N9R5_TRYRA|nr:uncharacterized protein TraAM80_06528 [Trypanosoma rangeli]RNF02200.1 hypothetical protein TraAM80_06528 [Trypanosoma rangeli]|eukprot:RNF02200.1 hypothetical protein TraAM80_06528 [Trypanosoma rangeli]
MCAEMAEQPFIVVSAVTLSQAARCYSPLNASLQIKLEYTVLRPVINPAWAVLFEADISYRRFSVPLFKPTACSECGSLVNAASSSLQHTPSDGVTTLRPGASYRLDVHLESMAPSAVEEKYLLQVGMLRLILFTGNTEIDTVNFVVQVKKTEDGELMRLIMNPMV